jgi:hypothetical protein
VNISLCHSGGEKGCEKEEGEEITKEKGKGEIKSKRCGKRLRAQLDT